jgi:ribosomal protein L37AE/L43A
MRHNCAHPGCTNEGILRVAEGVWLCAKHMTERVYTPKKQASEDPDDHGGGGEPS